MLENKVDSIIIVGGGTAGWMTAAYLNKVFGESIQISLVESPSISTIGVGEATFSTVKLFFDFLGLKEHEWMPQCAASYKLAIKFVDWNAEKKYFYHPFQRHEIVDGVNMGEWWVKLQSDIGSSFDRSCFSVPLLCDNNRSPRFFDGRIYDHNMEEYQSNKLADLQVQLPYGYHFNAGQLASFLKGFATNNGVLHILDDVINVKEDDDGNILHINTKAEGHISGDLFIDCTGFKGMLINKVMNEPFISFSDSLLCDSALAMQIPTNIERDGMHPYTSATALESGWVWNIPLYGRDGTGYVYSSAFVSTDEAERQFRKHLGNNADNCNVSAIKMRIGRTRNAWVKNCVAIGLSSGFVEPLESTGIFFIQQGIEELAAALVDKQIDPKLVKQYNKATGDCIDGVRDFLILHYYASTRYDSPFWMATKHDLKISEDLKERLEIWKNNLPNSENINSNYHGFESYSYSVMLMGLGYKPKFYLPILNDMNAEKALDAFRGINERAKNLVSTLPSVYEYLTSVHDKMGKAKMEV